MPVGPEVGLATVHDSLDLGDDATYDVGLRPGADPRHVGERRQWRERAPAEVEHEELRLERRGGQRHAGDDGAQQRALPAPRTADHGDVARRSGQVDGHRVAALLPGPVDGAEGDDEPTEPAPVRRDQAELGVLHEVRHQLVEGVGHVEWRQPDLVGRRPVADHLTHRDVQQRVLLLALPDRRRLGLGRRRFGLGGRQRLHLRDRERQDPLHLPALVAADPHLPARRSGDVRRLEPHQARLVGLEVPEARDRRQLVGVRDPEHRARLPGAERAQPDPVGQVRLESAEPALLEPLRGQQQVQAQGAAQPADGHEQVDELGLRRQHLGELVDDDEQRRQRLEVLAGGPGLLVVADRREVAGLAQQLLAAHHLAGQGVLHPVDQGELLGEVGDHRRHVRHPGHAGKGRAALEVDEHQVQVLGGVRHREAEDERAQELRLAGAGRPDHQSVRTHPLLGGLLDVEVHHRAALAEADRHPQPVPGGTVPPGRRGFEGVDVAQAEQVHEVGGTGDLARGGLGRAGGHGVQRGDAPGERLRRGQVALVGQGPDRLLAEPQRGHRRLAVLGRPPALREGVELEPQPGGVLELVPAGRQVEHGDAVQPVRRDDVVAGRQPGGVGDEQDVGRGRTLLGAEPRTVAEVRRQQRGDVGQRRGDHPARPDGVRLLGTLGVREPLQPVPVREVLLGREDRDREVLGGVERRRRAEHRPGQGPRGLLRPAQLDPVEGPQVDAGRQLRLQPVDDEQPVQRRRGGRVDLVDGGALRRDQLQGQRLRADAVPDVQEVGVGAAVLPHPGPLLRQRGEGGGLGVVPVQGPSLLVGGLPGHLAHVGEVAQVLRAGRRSPAGRAASAAGPAGR